MNGEVDPLYREARRVLLDVIGKLDGLRLVDCDELTIGALEIGDPRRFRLRVAGPGALLIAKLHKLGDRIGDERRRDRLEPKDAYEAYRLMQLPKKRGRGPVE